MASHLTLNSALPGLITVYTDDHGATEGSPGTAYFEFNNSSDASTACIRASKCEELFCVQQVPTKIEDEKCFGFAVRPEEKDKDEINDMMQLIEKINYWMGSFPNEEKRKIPIQKLDHTTLKERDFSVPQKNYGKLLGAFGLEPATHDPYQEPQDDVVHRNIAHEKE